MAVHFLSNPLPLEARRPQSLTLFYKLVMTELFWQAFNFGLAWRWMGTAVYWFKVWVYTVLGGML